MFFSVLLLCSKRAMWAATFKHIMIYCPSKLFAVKQLKMKMKTIKYLNFPDKNNHIDRIYVSVKNIDHRFCMIGELLNLFLLSVSTRIDYTQCLEGLENATKLIVSTAEQMLKLSSYFHLKIYLLSENFLYIVSPDDYFL